MTAYSFKRQFVKPILAHEKQGTIRKERVDGHVPRLGSALQLYSGMRTKYCFKIGDAICAGVRGVAFHVRKRVACTLYIDGDRLPLDRLALFAKADGFETWAAMEEFWRAEHGVGWFRGHQIVWTNFTPADGAAERAARP